MNGSIEKARLAEAAVTLFDEAHRGPAGSGTWFVDNEPGCGLFGTLGGLDAERASRPLGAGDPLTPASHAAHLRYALSLANRAARGEDPYKDANWARSWDTRNVDEAEWKALLAGLEKEYEELRRVMGGEQAWESRDFMTGLLGLIAHAAWHLGALRQGLGLVKSPK